MPDWLDGILGRLRAAASFGREISEDGAELLGHVPHIAPEAWFHIIYPPIEQSAKTDLTKRLDQRIPDAYEELLNTTNGLTAFSGALSLFGSRSDFSRRPSVRQPFDAALSNVLERPTDVPDGYFCFGFYDEDGSKLWLEAPSQVVVRLSPEGGESLNRWDDLPSALTSEISRLSGLFDSQGREQEPGTPTCPAPVASPEH